MSTLIDKLRRARETKVQAGGYTFTVRRPTDVEVIGLRDAISFANLLPFVVNWDGVREMDLIPGGDPHPLPFDAALATEWLADRPDLLRPITEAILDAYARHVEHLGTISKN